MMLKKPFMPFSTKGLKRESRDPRKRRIGNGPATVSGNETREKPLALIGREGAGSRKTASQETCPDMPHGFFDGKEGEGRAVSVVFKPSFFF